MARLLFLGASVSQLPAIRFAKERGHTVIACDADPAAVAFAFCDAAEVVSFSDVDAVSEVGERHHVEGVLAVCTDRAVLPAALVARRLRLPGLSPPVARAMSHKPTMRDALALAGVPQPEYRVLGGDFDAATWRRLPAVVKPADSGGQRGLALVRDVDAVGAAAEEALAVSSSGEAMLEEYVDGLELNGLYVVRDGTPLQLIASDRLRPSGQGFGVGWIHSYPSAATPAQLSAVDDVACAAVRALGMRDGIAFPQLIVTEERTVLIEIAARVAAGQMADLLWHARGIRIYEIAIRQALGLPIDDRLLRANRSRPVAIRFLTASPGHLPVGTVESIAGLEDVRAAPGVLDAALYFGPGAVIEPVRVDADRRGYVIATATTAAAALRRADTAAKLLRVETRQSHRLATVLPPLTCAMLLIATVGGFVASERGKLARPFVSATRVDSTFAPTCRCPQEVAHLSFRLLRATRMELGVVDARGRLVRLLVRYAPAAVHLVRAVWNGRSRTGAIAPGGAYYPEVILPALRRTLRLPSPILLDRDRPRVLAAVATLHGRRLTVRYRFSEPAHAVVVVDGVRRVFTRFEPVAGLANYTLPRPSPNIHVAVAAVDLAGNRSRARRVRVTTRLEARPRWNRAT